MYNLCFAMETISQVAKEKVKVIIGIIQERKVFFWEQKNTNSSSRMFSRCSNVITGFGVWGRGMGNGSGDPDSILCSFFHPSLPSPFQQNRYLKPASELAQCISMVCALSEVACKRAVTFAS